ncbi:MAG TPA: nucleotide exchange factor GrpE [Puia sp.]|nr:nucleotide exchange factor GrpE [Puia sp.]
MQENDTRSSKDEFGRKPRENAQNVQEDLNTDENIAGTSHLNDTMEEDSELEKTREELQGQKEKYLRLFAEFDNFRKRSAKESLELRQTAGKEVIVSLLDVMDDCDRAEKQLQNAENIDQVKEGIQLVFSKLRSVLQNRGLKAMESIHTDFDVEKHEAITEIPVQDPSLKGKVIDDVQKGYYLNDKIIRFAKVVVGK